MAQQGLDLSHLRPRQVADDVDVVDRQVDDHPDLAHARREGADAGDLDGDDLVAVDGALDRLDRRVEALDMADHQHALIRLGRVDHRLSIGHRSRDRLLDQHMNAGVQQGHAQLGVIAVRRGDDGGVQPGGDEGLGGRHGGRPIGGGHALGRHGVRIKDGGQLHIAQLGQNASVVAAHDASARDADLEGGLLGHGVRP